MEWIAIFSLIAILIGTLLFLSRHDQEEKIKSEIEAESAKEALDETIRSHESQKETRQEFDGLRDFYGDSWDELRLRQDDSGKAPPAD